MIRSYIVLFILAFILSLLDAPIWSLVLLFILFVLYYLHTQFYPLLFEKDVNKILDFLKISKNKQHQFTYHLMLENTYEAEQLLKQIKSKSLKDLSVIMLLTKQKRYNEAKDLFFRLTDNEYKWYYGAIISLKLGELELFEEYKARLKNPVHISWIDMEQLLSEGKKAEVLSLLEKQLPTLRGLKLLSAYTYKKEITQEDN